MGHSNPQLKGTELVLYPYRVTDFNFPLIPPPDPTFRLKWIDKRKDKATRAPIRVSLGCHVVGAAQPVPDTKHTGSALAGVIKRVATNMPPVQRATYRRLKRFTDRWLNKNCKHMIFNQDEAFDFNEWIDNAPYTELRKEELRKEHEKFSPDKFNKKNSHVKCHVKDESYPEYKFPRGIYSRTDAYKTFVGPFFAKLSDRILHSKWFIKHIPVDKRPQVLLDMFADKPNLYCTDYSSYEATFVRRAMLSVEFRLYNFVLQNNPHRDEIMKQINLMTRVNRCEFWSFCFNISAKRMSGEMCTSLGNGFFNLILSFFLAREKGNKYYEGMFEGDDGIQWVDKIRPTDQDYANLGCNIKIDIPTCMNEASFCGNVFDVEDKEIVVSPAEAIVSFGYTGKQYIKASKFTKLALLKAKSLSMLYTYPACPMLRELALYGLRMTDEIKDDYMIEKFKRSYEYKNSYVKKQFDEVFDNLGTNIDDKIKNKFVKPRTRLLVQEKYGISCDLQIKFEKYMRNKNKIEPINFPELLTYLNKDCVDYFYRYSVNVTKDMKLDGICNVSCCAPCVLYKTGDPFAVPPFQPFKILN